MRVFLRKATDGEYASVNFSIAADGFKTLGWELRSFSDSDQSDVRARLAKEDVYVDFVAETREAIRQLGIDPPTLPTYPEALARFLGRKVWKSTIDTLVSQPDLWPVFVKPQRDTKAFTGLVVRRTGDFIGCRNPKQDTEIWCAEPVQFVSEWRCFIRYGAIVDVRPYRGSWKAQVDARVIEEAVSAWDGKPNGCALDFGLDDNGRTVLVEANEGFALGAYGLHPVDYAKLLSARWAEITGTKDEANG